MSTKTALRKTQAERTEASDQNMLDAAIQLIVAKGPAATSLKDVGILAGYSRGLAGHRFGSKDKLFAFVLRRVGDEWLNHLMAATSGKTGIDAVHQALDEHYQFCVDAPDHVRTFYTLWFESVNAGSELAEIIKNIHHRRHYDVRKWILDADDVSDETKHSADAIAGQFCASIIGIVYYWMANPADLEGTRSLHEQLKTNMALFLTA
jgi:AcrR family transcriptional regulator